MAPDIDERRAVVVKLDAQPASRALADLSNRRSGRLIELVAIDQPNMVREDFLDDENIATVRVIFLSRQFATPLNGLADISEADLGKLFNDAADRNARLFNSALNALLMDVALFAQQRFNPLHHSLILLQAAGIA